LSPCNDVDGGKKRFNVGLTVGFKAQIRARCRRMRLRGFVVAFEAVAGPTSTASTEAEILPIYSATLYLCMQWIFAAGWRALSRSARYPQAESEI
jgi:hypothetical protein